MSVSDAQFAAAIDQAIRLELQPLVAAWTAGERVPGVGKVSVELIDEKREEIRDRIKAYLAAVRQGKR